MNSQAEVKGIVSERYAEGAKERQEALCCPVDYDVRLLELLPQEIVERDYGCGDPSRYVQEGDTVLDLGSGGGKICYMAAQLVGETGNVIGIDMTDEMLALARKYQAEMAEKIGSDRVTFHKGYIQDLAFDLKAQELFLENNSSLSIESLEFQDWQQQQKIEQPLIADNSIDLVVSNCVLNLVAETDRKQMIDGIFRVLKPGGHVAISDIVSDESVPEHLKSNEELWTGCISGAFQEKQFSQAFLDAGFVLVNYDKWDASPWQVVEGIEFRSVTLMAIKPTPKVCLDVGQAVIYKGPYSEVRDDEDHIYPRGERIAVCERSYKFLTEGPMKDDFIGISPAVAIEGKEFCAPAGTVRFARESKGSTHNSTSGGNSCC
ncbi:MAG: methyltransferase domain-containing protein [Pseudomonadales bacterium]|nr:methyltransferase domain-containing protein [Pseudomonadales bacterium]